MKSVIFTNWTDQSFTWTWANVPYTFHVGQSVYIEDYLANHFAKHLVDRELFKQKKQTNDQTRDELLKKCIQDNSTIEAASPEKLAMDTMNANQPMVTQKKAFCDQCDSKGMRHKKECPTTQSKKEEEEFEGLNK